MYKKIVKVLLIVIVGLIVTGIGFSYSKVKENTQVGSVMNDFVVYVDEDIDQENETQNDIVQNFVEENVVEKPIAEEKNIENRIEDETIADKNDVEDKKQNIVKEQVKQNESKKATVNASKNSQKENTNSKQDKSSDSSKTKTTTTNNLSNNAQKENAATKNNTTETKSEKINNAIEKTKEKEKETTVSTTEKTEEKVQKEKVKSIYDYPFNIDAIRNELIKIGEDMGLKHLIMDEDIVITPQNHSWSTTVTATKTFQGEMLKRSLIDYVTSMPEIIVAYGGEKIDHFTIYVEDKGNGSYKFYYIY